MQLLEQAKEILDDPDYLTISAAKSNERFEHTKWIIPFRYAAIAGALILVINQLIMHLLANNEEVLTAYSDINTIFFIFLAVMALFYGARVSQIQGRRIYIAWMIICIAMVSFLIGDLIYAYIDLILQQDTLASAADFFYILFFPIFLTGILILPGIKFSPSERLKVMLDSGIVLLAAAIIFWSFIIAPTIELSMESDTVTLMLSMAYPLLDLVLLFAVLELIFKRIYQKGQKPLLLLAAGSTFLIIADAIYLRQLLEETYIAGGLIDSVWPLGCILIGLAGVAQAEAVREGLFESPDGI